MAGLYGLISWLEWISGWRAAGLLTDCPQAHDKCILTCPRCLHPPPQGLLSLGPVLHTGTNTCKQRFHDISHSASSSRVNLAGLNLAGFLGIAWQCVCVNTVCVLVHS